MIPTATVQNQLGRSSATSITNWPNKLVLHNNGLERLAGNKHSSLLVQSWMKTYNFAVDGVAEELLATGDDGAPELSPTF